MTLALQSAFYNYVKNDSNNKKNNKKNNNNDNGIVNKKNYGDNTVLW